MTETTLAPAPGEVAVPTKTWQGQNVPRKEDKRLTQGQGVFVDDVKRHGMGYVHFVRSPSLGPGEEERLHSCIVRAGGLVGSVKRGNLSPCRRPNLLTPCSSSTRYKGSRPRRWPTFIRRLKRG